MKWALLLVAACGTSSSTVTLEAPGTQTYFGGTIDGRAWQTFDGAADGPNTAYELSIDGDFELLMVCENAMGAFTAAELYGTADDATVSIGSWHVPDCTSQPQLTGNIVVTGSLDDQGFVAIGNKSAFIQEAGPFTLQVAGGTRDVVYTANFIVGITHDQPINGATDLGSLSLAANGSPMLTRDYAPLSITGESVEGWLDLETRNGTSTTWNYRDLADAVFVPQDQLAYGDVQTFHVLAARDTGYRTASATGFSTVAPQFEFIGPLQSYAWDPNTRTIRWTPITDYYTTASIEFLDGDTGDSATATASKLWMDRRARYEITVDESAPGFHWQVKNPASNFVVESWSPDLVLQSSTSQAFHPVR